MVPCCTGGAPLGSAPVFPLLLLLLLLLLSGDGELPPVASGTTLPLPLGLELGLEFGLELGLGLAFPFPLLFALLLLALGALLLFCTQRGWSAAAQSTDRKLV